MPAATIAAWRRWLAVIAATAVVVALPWAIDRLPAEAGDLPAADLAARIAASGDVAYSGYAESAGGLVLPVGTYVLGDLADLFGDRTRMRVWYASPTAHRVDAIGYTGETDVYTDADGAWTWDYEAERATRSPRPGAAVSIPAPADLLPPAVARRVLSHADPGDLAPLPAQRIAGRAAAGLRLTPSDPAATIERIEVWADEATGLALRVAVYGPGGAPALDTAFLDLDLGSPDPALLAFRPPPGAEVVADDADLVDLLQQRDGIAPGPMPAALAGFALTGDAGIQAVGVYGDTVTSFVAILLPERAARSLRRALGDAPTTVVQAGGLSSTIGPLSALLVDSVRPGPRSRWLLVGTVTVETLVAASAGLPPTGSGR